MKAKRISVAIRQLLFRGALAAMVPSSGFAGEVASKPGPDPASGQDPDSEVLMWADDKVDQVSDYLGYGVNWFDGFFDNDRYTDETQAKVHVRWRNDFSYVQGEDGFDYKPRVSARVDLPRFHDRVKLLIFADDDDELADMESRGMVTPLEDQDERNEVGVSYTLLDGLAEHLSLRGSMRINPAEFIVKLRHRASWNVSDDLYSRLTTTAFYNTREGFGLKMKSDLEWPLSDLALLRWSNYGIWDEEHHHEGVNWSSVVTRYRKLSERRAISYSAGVVGHSRPDLEADSYFIRARYRQNFLRPWLFVEFVPEVFWPQDYRKEDCSTCFALLTRVEVVFREWE